MFSKLRTRFSVIALFVCAASACHFPDDPDLSAGWSGVDRPITHSFTRVLDLQYAPDGGLLAAWANVRDGFCLVVSRMDDPASTMVSLGSIGSGQQVKLAVINAKGATLQAAWWEAGYIVSAEYSQGAWTEQRRYALEGDDPIVALAFYQDEPVFGIYKNRASKVVWWRNGAWTEFEIINDFRGAFSNPTRIGVNETSVYFFIPEQNQIWFFNASTAASGFSYTNMTGSLDVIAETGPGDFRFINYDYNSGASSIKGYHLTTNGILSVNLPYRSFNIGSSEKGEHALMSACPLPDATLLAWADGSEDDPQLDGGPSALSTFDSSGDWKSGKLSTVLVKNDGSLYGLATGFSAGGVRDIRTAVRDNQVTIAYSDAGFLFGMVLAWRSFP